LISAPEQPFDRARRRLQLLRDLFNGAPEDATENPGDLCAPSQPIEAFVQFVNDVGIVAKQGFIEAVVSGANETIVLGPPPAVTAGRSLGGDSKPAPQAQTLLELQSPRCEEQAHEDALTDVEGFLLPNSTAGNPVDQRP
jgi:hypothetical protein